MPPYVEITWFLAIAFVLLVFILIVALSTWRASASLRILRLGAGTTRGVRIKRVKEAPEREGAYRREGMPRPVPPLVEKPKVPAIERLDKLRAPPVEQKVEISRHKTEGLVEKLEEQYRQGIISKETYEELKRRIGG